MKTVLVSGASGIVGYGILKSLRTSGLELRLVGTTIYQDSVAGSFCDEVVIAPKTSESGYLEWLLEIIESYSVDLIIPGIEIDMFHWSENLDQLTNSRAKVCINNQELINLCKDKWEFYCVLSKLNTPYAIPSSIDANFDSSVNEFGIPMLIKPKRGFGSKGIIRITERKEWEVCANEIGKTLMVQPLIGSDSEEYTTSAYGDGHGGISATMTLKRTLSEGGYTQEAEVIENEEIDLAVKELSEKFRPLGPTNFQFRLTNDGPKLLEINPRISSSNHIRAGFGYNESSMVVEHLLFGKKPTQPTLKKGKAIRYVEEKFFYQ